MLSFFRDDPYSLSEIRQTLDESFETQPMLFALLEKHHRYLRESIPVLLDKIAPLDEKQRHLTRFLHLLGMHAHAEEETLYRALLETNEREAHLEGMAGEDEHLFASKLASELEDLNYATNWSEEADAKSRVLAGLVDKHIREEERGLFGIAKKYLSPTEISEIKSEYLEKCKHYLDLEMQVALPKLDERMIERGL